jgi:hypothetical protein
MGWCPGRGVGVLCWRVAYSYKQKDCLSRGLKRSIENLCGGLEGTPQKAPTEFEAHWGDELARFGIRQYVAFWLEARLERLVALVGPQMVLGAAQSSTGHACCPLKDF